MGRVRQPVSAGTHATGFAEKLVIIENIDTTKHIATVKDKLGYRHTVRTDVLPAKGAAPEVGETWIIDRMGSTWTLRAVIGHSGLTAVVESFDFTWTGSLSIITSALRRYVESPATLASVRASLGTVATGSVVVDVLVNGSSVAAVTIPSGSHTAVVHPSLAVAEGDYFTVNVPTIGSGGADLVVTVRMNS